MDVEKDAEQHTEPSPSTLEVEESSPWWKFWSKKSERNDEEEAPEKTNLKEVVGVVRGSEKPSIFVPANDPSSGQWFYVDVPAIADACGLPQNVIYIEDIDSNVNPSNPYPIPKDVNTLIRTSVMPQDHLNYIITWYTLSTVVTGMAYKRLKTTKKRY